MDLFKLKSPETWPGTLLSEVPMHWDGGAGAEEQLSTGCSRLLCKGMILRWVVPRPRLVQGQERIQC